MFDFFQDLISVVCITRRVVTKVETLQSYSGFEILMPLKVMSGHLNPNCLLESVLDNKKRDKKSSSSLGF